MTEHCILIVESGDSDEPVREIVATFVPPLRPTVAPPLPDPERPR
jgi:hypothetical protein